MGKRNTRTQRPSWSGPVDSEELTGTVVAIVYRGDAGFIVARLAPGRTDPGAVSVERRETVTLTGVAPDLQPGNAVRATGRWRRHRTHGRQFVAVAIAKFAPGAADDGQIAALECTKALLASRLIPGVGRRTADQIIGHFGTEVIDVLADAPARLAEVPGIGDATAERIGRAWAELRDVREVMAYLQRVGVPPAEAIAFYREVGADRMRRLHLRLGERAEPERGFVLELLAELNGEVPDRQVVGGRV